MLLYTLLTVLFDGAYWAFAVFLLSLAHAIIAFVVGLILLATHRKTSGLAFLLSSLIVPLIGLSMCLGGLGSYN